MGGAGPLTTARDKHLAQIPRRRSVQRSVGTTFLTSGLEAAFRDFVGHYALPGYTELHMLRDAYQKSKADQNINLPHDAAELVPVEEAIGYHFRNKKLLEMALTSPVDGHPGPDYDRVEYLGDGVLEVLAVDAWINEGSVARSGPKTQDTVCNRTLQAVCLDIGLEDHIRRCDEDTQAKIAALKTSYPALKTQAANKPYWKQGQLCKTLGDVVESVYGAVYLDSGLRLSAVEDVFNRIHWPIVEKRLA